MKKLFVCFYLFCAPLKFKKITQFVKARRASKGWYRERKKKNRSSGATTITHVTSSSSCYRLILIERLTRLSIGKKIGKLGI